MSKLSRPRRRLLCSVTLGLSLGFFVYLAWLRTSHALVHAFDTGLYLQILHNMAYFGDLASSMVGEDNFLAHHFQPIIVALAPLMYVSSSPMVLFLVSLVSVVAAIWVFCQYGPIPTSKWNYLFLFSVAILWHPTIANRIYFSFVPEVMALPFLMGQACLLYKTPLNRNRIIWLLVCQIGAGLCKENLWLVNMMVSLTLIWVDSPRRKLHASLAVVNLGLFVFLFLYWMPHHTNLTSYYAMRYFVNPAATLPGKLGLLQGMVYNVFTEQSLTTLFYIILSVGVLGVVYPTRQIWPAAVGIGFIMVSSHSPLHMLGNQYLILSLPFLWVGTAHALQQPLFDNPAVQRWICFCLVITPLFMTLAGRFGVYLHLNTTKIYPYTALIPGDLEEVKKTIKPDAFILADANLSTRLIEFRNLKNILNFVGNPYQLSESDMVQATDVVTSAELRSLPNGCRGVEEIKSSDKLDYNYDSFYKFCDWLVGNKMTVKSYPESKIYHYYYAAPP